MHTNIALFLHFYSCLTGNLFTYFSKAGPRMFPIRIYEPMSLIRITACKKSHLSTDTHDANAVQILRKCVDGLCRTIPHPWGHKIIKGERTVDMLSLVYPSCSPWPQFVLLMRCGCCTTTNNTTPGCATTGIAPAHDFHITKVMCTRSAFQRYPYRLVYIPPPKQFI